MVNELCCALRERRRILGADFGDVFAMRYFLFAKEGCDFFKWADTVHVAQPLAQPVPQPEPVPEQEEPQIARLRRKISCLKAKVKVLELKLKFVAAMGLIGWVAFVCVWMNKNCNAGQVHGLVLKFG
ncbi:hypothetical protein PIB30_019100 [Stylosanthes scabra]|uniref:Uncharacterized protein n=1 Tax=Stylosanthes scabra TaxID=79078 RepID=A0ABU6VAF2_9FABA|nr:hypothetical protein [Stylosanthes scabra]